METSKKPKFRIIIKDIELDTAKVNTIYEDETNKNMSLNNFVTKLLEKIGEM